MFGSEKKELILLNSLLLLSLGVFISGCAKENTATDSFVEESVLNDTGNTNDTDVGNDTGDTNDATPAQKRYETTFATLTPFHGYCTSESAMSDYCFSAIDSFCRVEGFLSGFGPVAYEQEDVHFVCVPSSGALRVETTFSILSYYNEYCTAGDPMSGPCNGAIDLYCRTAGYISGFGPTQHLDDFVHFACVNTASAERVESSFSDLNKYHSYCSADNPMSGACNGAIDLHCRTAGFQSGFGPVAYSGDVAHWICIK